MNIKIKSEILSQTAIECGLWHIQRHLIEKHGNAIAEQDMYPLQWYIATGRASTTFLHKLFNAKPFMVARKLHQGGSMEDAIDRVKKYIGMERESC